MGIENRDYYRYSSRDTYRPSSFSDMPGVCKRLLIATVVVFLAQIFFTRSLVPDSNFRDAEQFLSQGLESLEEQQQLLEEELGDEIPEAYQVDPSDIRL